jgi:hypothetical protein
MILQVASLVFGMRMPPNQRTIGDRVKDLAILTGYPGLAYSTIVSDSGFSRLACSHGELSA